MEWEKGWLLGWKRPEEEVEIEEQRFAAGNGIDFEMTVITISFAEVNCGDGERENEIRR